MTRLNVRWALDSDLLDHFVFEKLLLVQDLDGNGVPGLRVPGEPDLGERALADGPA